jgi:hypothetical protein
LSSLRRPATAQEVAAPRRLVTFYTGNGVQMERWFPNVTNGALAPSNFTGTSLEAIGSHAPKLLFPRGLAMTPRGFNIPGPSFDPHDQGMGSKLTAELLSADDRFPLGHSVDFEAGKRVNQQGDNPLVILIGAQTGQFGGVKAYTSYSAPQTPYPGETSPINVYRSLTGLFNTDAEQEYLIRQRQSIIDLCAGDLETFKRLPMSGDDKRKVDDWLALIRETETRMIPASCTPAAPTALGLSEAEMESFGSGGGFGGPSQEVRFKAGGDMMMRLAVLSMICDANRVITIQWQGLGGPTFTWDGMSHTYTHHQLSHRTGSDEAGGEVFLDGVEDMIAQIDRWYAGRYNTLVSLIDNFTEGEGTMLDNSAVVWMNELADGQRHDNANLPIVVAGSAGGYLRTGVAVDLGIPASGGFDRGNTGTPLTKFYTTLLNAIGAKGDDGGPIQSFGNLEYGQPGEIAEIKA